ncbi:electron transport complex subunit RsxG [Alteromonas sp. CYL-A6]|uniref:electron transport complex subunit RsxG n=1 Tax=Alteromonas nitratireducens TaxID=3390813 RepID=UPI0034C2D694
MLTTISKNGGMLAAFAIVTTALISLTYNGTRATIEEKKQARLLGVLTEVVPTTYFDSPLYRHCTVVSDPLLGNSASHRVYLAVKNNEVQAFAVEATAPDGYSGNIALIVGVSKTMDVLGVRVLDHKETPGLGDKIELAVSDWITGFTGRQFDPDNLIPWQVKKDGGDFDQFTGATITPRAVVGAVKNALLFVSDNKNSLTQADNACSINPGASNE